MTHVISCALLAGLLAAPASAAAPITAAAFTPDGKQVVVGSQSGIEIRSWPDLKRVAVVKAGLSHVHDLAFSPDGKTLLAAGGSPAEEGAAEAIAWPPHADRRRRISVGKDLVYRVAWSPDGSRWATAGADGVCRVFTADVHKQKTRYEGHSRAVLAIAFLPDGKTIVSASVDQTLQVWDADSGKAVRTLDNHVAAVNDVAVRPRTAADEPTTIASVSDDRTLRLWQPTTGRLLRFARLDSPPRCVVWSPDGTRLFAGCNDGRVRSFDPGTLEVTRVSPELGVRLHTLVAHADGKHLFLAGASGSMRVAEVREGK